MLDIKVCLDASGEIIGGRKRSYSMTEEEDLTNVPSLQMRISILQQRVSKTFLVDTVLSFPWGWRLFCQTINRTPIKY